MGAMQRRKGAQGEREFLAKCRRELNLPTLQRNLDQVRHGGGADAPRRYVKQLGGFVLEIKRTARWENRFWIQAQEQAQKWSGEPALAYRGNSGRWVVMVRSAVVGAQTASGTVLLCEKDWFDLVRERLIAFERL